MSTYIPDRAKLVSIIHKIFADNSWTWWNKKTSPERPDIAHQIDTRVGELLADKRESAIECGRLKVQYSWRRIRVYVEVGEIKLNDIDMLHLERFALDQRCDRTIEEIKKLDAQIELAESSK